MQSIAFLGLAVLVRILLASDRQRARRLSAATWLAVAWILLISSRPLSEWFELGAAGSTQSYDEGSPIDRVAYFGLLTVAVGVLARRGVRLGSVVASNIWLSVFLAYCLASVCWSDLPDVAAKRWIKEAGNVVMVLLVLTEVEPLEAVKAVLFRSACLLLPASMFFTRFVPELGRTYHVWSGEMMYIGVTTHKNSLGMLVLVNLLFLVWGFLERPGNHELGRPFGARLSDAILAVLGSSLLLMAGSSTATGCVVLGVFCLAALKAKPMRHHVRIVESVALSLGLVLWISGTGGDWIDRLVRLMGRDPTLTSRTDVWPMLAAHVDNVWFGSGFNSFWTGTRLADIYGRYNIIQAHNGYLEAFLNGGGVGLVLLACALLAALARTNRMLMTDQPQARFAFTVVWVTLVYNLTEASFSKMSPLWFLFLLVTVQYRDQRQPAPLRRTADGTVPEAAARPMA